MHTYLKGSVREITFANNVILAFLGFIQLKYPVPSIFYMKKVNLLHVKTVSMRGPGRRDTSYLSDLDETWSN